MKKIATLPPLGITMGCPASIGPEIIIKHFSSPFPAHRLPQIVIGNIQVLKKSGESLGISTPITPWAPGQKIAEHAINVFDPSITAIVNHQWGVPNLSTAHAMAGYIKSGVELINEKQLSGITTCPISKDSLQNSGYKYPGHTEMLADLTSTKNYGMMLAGPKIRVSLATIHCPLTKVVDFLSVKTLVDIITLTYNTLERDLGIKCPKLAVAGLNPHAGENGLFGDEEQLILSPAIETCRKQGMKVSDPLPADTVFYQNYCGNFDAVVCMYHDQGLAPFKLVHFSDGVNLTMGLPIVRTSVDHGTAYNIAGQGVADHKSLSQATKLAEQIISNRQTY